VQRITTRRTALTPPFERSFAVIGQGMTVWAATAACSEPQLGQAQALLGCFGDEVRVADEQYLDMATALVGSGPAFTLLFMEAMIDAGVHMGFPRDTAKKLVQKTVEGSAALVAQSPTQHIAQLRNDITSPGGTTAAAIYSCDQGGFRTTVADAIWAAYRRSLELGGEDSRVGPGRSKL
jgi:pyrroline-5-carboxylate reductase